MDPYFETENIPLYATDAGKREKAIKSKKNPNPKLEMLRRQMKDAKKRTNNPSLKRRSQTEFFQSEQVQQLQKIIDAKNPKNIEIAVDLMRIFRRASSGEYQMVADERGRNVDHEKLFLITRFDPFGAKCKICRSKIDKNTIYCHGCAYSKG